MTVNTSRSPRPVAVAGRHIWASPQCPAQIGADQRLKYTRPGGPFIQPYRLFRWALAGGLVRRAALGGLLTERLPVDD
ncbi:hypothetical protein [Halorussus lipolyticus]|uniref:hypothetical protein n=1 Tax=Halorussus lipolyticus TaxID=3034024 RepID=UPI0023E871D1|nr:hypothetical protein [Halorussus sp. DT80]